MYFLILLLSDRVFVSGHFLLTLYEEKSSIILAK